MAAWDGGLHQHPHCHLGGVAGGDWPLDSWLRRFAKLADESSQLQKALASASAERIDAVKLSMEVSAEKLNEFIRFIQGISRVVIRSDDCCAALYESC
jgi:hypothetical protein